MSDMRALGAEFVRREVAPHLQEWEDAGEIPRELHLVAAKQGLLGISFPESVGGEGGDVLDTVDLQEGMFEAGANALNSANVFIAKLNALLDQNEKSINTTMANVEQFTTMLAEKREDIGQAITDVKEGANSFKTLSSKLEVSLGDNMDGLTRQARDSIQEFGNFMREGRKTAVTLNRILEKLEADPRGFLLGGNQVPEYTPRGR